jgi:hypothetical protein
MKVTRKNKRIILDLTTKDADALLYLWGEGWVGLGCYSPDELNMNPQRYIACRRVNHGMGRVGRYVAEIENAKD